MKNKFALFLILSLSMANLWAQDSIEFKNMNATRTLSLTGTHLSFDTLKGQREQREASTCQRQLFKSEIQKLLKYPVHHCSKPTAQITVSIAKIKRTIGACRSLLPSYEEVLSRISNCAK